MEKGHEYLSTAETPKEEIAHLEQEVQQEQTQRQAQMHEGMSWARETQLAPDPKILSISEKILTKGLHEQPHLSLALKGKQLEMFQKNLYKEHPELWQFLTFELQINNMSSKNFDKLKASEKIKLLALYGAIHDILPLVPGLQDKNKRFVLEKFRRRYQHKLESVMSSAMSSFKRDQLKNFGDTKNTLINEYKISPTDAQIYATYLKKVQEDYEKTQPTQARTGWFVAGVVVGVLAAAGGYAIYDRIFNPQSGEKTVINDINLGDPSLLARLVTAEQGFSVTGEKTEYLYDTNGDSSIWGVAKDLINKAQSRSVTMLLEGSVGVEYDLDTKNGASFVYSPRTKMIHVYLPKPTFTLRDNKAKILARNSEVLEIDRFNNTEQKLRDELSEKAIQEARTQGKLIKASEEQAAQVIYSMYGPILERFGKEVKGINVIIDDRQQVNFPLDSLKL